MNRSELVRAVAERAGSEEAAARRHVDAVVETVMERVSAGERVIVTGFGTFDRISRPARKARNPRTGLPIEVPAAEVPRFRVGQTFRNRVGQSAPTLGEELAPESAVAVVAEATSVEESGNGEAVEAVTDSKAVKVGKKAKKGSKKAKAETRLGQLKSPAKAGTTAKAGASTKVGGAEKVGGPAKAASASKAGGAVKGGKAAKGGGAVKGGRGVKAGKGTKGGGAAKGGKTVKGAKAAKAGK